MGMRRSSVENRGPFMSKLVRFPWQTKPADLVGVESLTERLDVAVEARFREDLIQARVERMVRGELVSRLASRSASNGAVVCPSL